MLKLWKRVSTLILTLTVIVGIYSTINVNAAENYDGGWAFSRENHTVYSAANGGSAIGSIGREGITILSRSGTTYYIEYSTSRGAKRGYLV